MAILLTFHGCVTMHSTSLVRYHADEDRFDVLSILEDIRFEMPAEGKQIAAVWKNRKEWIPVQLDGGLLDLSVLRTKHKEVRHFGLAAANDDVTKVSFDLGPVIIKPGVFFANKASGLSYYHQFSIPGTVLDEVLKAAVNESRPEIQEWASKQTELDEQPVSWEMIRDAIRKKKDTFDVGDGSPFDDDTLKALVDRPIRVKRKASRVSIFVPMSMPDQAEVLETHKEFQQSTAEELASTTNYVAALVEKVELQTSDQELIIVFDLTRAAYPWDKRNKLPAKSTTRLEARDQTTPTGV